MSATQPESSLEQLLADTRQQLVALQQEHALLLKQQATLLHCLSHDLRTPAMTVLGFTDLLLTDSRPANEAQNTRQYLDHIRNSANRQISMINAMLNLCSVCHQPLQLSTVNLGELAREYLDHRSDRDALTAIEIDIQPTPVVRADAELAQRLLAALIDNAIKFSRKTVQPVIRFGAEQTGTQTVFFISDNGAGFNIERQDRLYKPFARLHSPKDFDGLGTGLATAQTIMQRHHGRLWAESQPDQGTTFRFVFESVPITSI